MLEEFSRVMPLVARDVIYSFRTMTPELPPSCTSWMCVHGDWL